MTVSGGGRVLVSGVTGLVGRRLVQDLVASGRTVRGLSRSGTLPDLGVPSSQLEAQVWDGIDPGPEALVDLAAVVHLSGEPIFGGVPTAKRLARVKRSRVESTARLVDRMADLSEGSRPKVFVCASAVGIYGDRGETELDEAASVGEGFLAEVCEEWEREAQRAEALGIRVVRLRIGVVLAREGGALSLMAVPFRLGVGGRLGDGQQFFPWIHLDDLVRAVLWVLDSGLSGAVNAVAPEAVRNEDLTTCLGETLGRPTFLPVPAFAVRLALRDVAGELLGSRRVIPAQLAESGFQFSYPRLADALAEALS